MNSNSCGPSVARTWLAETVFPGLPDVLKDNIKEVNKVSTSMETGTHVKDGETTVDKLWIPSACELGSTQYETIGIVYELSSYVRAYGNSNNTWWCTRTIITGDYVVCEGGKAPWRNASNGVDYAIVPGFCI